MCGNEEKMSEMDQVRKAGAGCVETRPLVCMWPVHACGRREQSAQHTPSAERGQAREERAGGREGRVLI